jgi:hypothetical protein
MSARKLADIRDRLILITAPRSIGRTIVVQFYEAIYADLKSLHQRFKLHPSTVPLSRGWYPVATLGFPSCNPQIRFIPTAHHSVSAARATVARSKRSAIRHQSFGYAPRSQSHHFYHFKPRLSIRMHFPTQTHQRTPRIRTRAFILQRRGSPTSTSSATRSNGIF